MYVKPVTFCLVLLQNILYLIPIMKASRPSNLLLPAAFSRHAHRNWSWTRNQCSILIIQRNYFCGVENAHQLPISFNFNGYKWKVYTTGGLIFPALDETAFLGNLMSLEITDRQKFRNIMRTMAPAGASREGPAKVRRNPSWTETEMCAASRLV